MRKHYTEAQRAELVDLVISGRATPGAAAVQLGVPGTTAYYWLKRAGQWPLTNTPDLQQGQSRSPGSGQRAASPTFARLVDAAETPSAITLRAGNVIIEIRRGFDPVLLRDVVAALMGCAS